MADELVTVELGSIFRNFKQRAEKLRDDMTSEGGAILRREEEASIRLRWFDKGVTLRSLEEEFATENNTRIYRLFPTAVSKRGAPYPLFGEYGTGQAGARTGGPAPAGYIYGAGAGMAARRYSRIAVQLAKPQVVANARQLIANFTVN
jgi:hypothetical protein